MSLLLALVIGAAVTASASAVCSLKAASIKNERSEIVDMLEQSFTAMRRPDDTAGDAMTLSLINQEDTRVATKDAADAAPWIRTSAGFGILSAVLSLSAGLLAI